MHVHGVTHCIGLTELSNQKPIIFMKCPDYGYRQPNYPHRISVILLEDLSADRKRYESQPVIHQIVSADLPSKDQASPSARDKPR